MSCLTFKHHFHRETCRFNVGIERISLLIFFFLTLTTCFTLPLFSFGSHTWTTSPPNKSNLPPPFPSWPPLDSQSSWHNIHWFICYSRQLTGHGRSAAGRERANQSGAITKDLVPSKREKPRRANSPAPHSQHGVRTLNMDYSYLPYRLSACIL